MHIHVENKFNNIKNYTEIREEWDDFWLSLEKNRYCLGMKHLICCSVYNVSTLFRNLQKRYWTCRERGTLQICYTWSTVLLFVPDNSHREDYPNSPPGDALSRSVCLTPEIPFSNIQKVYHYRNQVIRFTVNA
jgi:hypothetical protein